MSIGKPNIGKAGIRGTACAHRTGAIDELVEWLRVIKKRMKGACRG